MGERKSDEDLFKAYLLGNDDAMLELLGRHGNNLTYYVNGYIHDLHYAEDLMMDAFSRVIAKRPRLAEGGFKPYLYKTARNLALRHVDRRSRIFSLEDTEIDPEDEGHVDDAVISSETAEALHRCLDRLPKDYREALYLVYVEDMGHEEAAQVMGKTKKQLYNLVSRGKASMRQLLADEGVTDAFG